MNDDGTWDNFLTHVNSTGYIPVKTYVIKVVEIDNKTKETKDLTDISDYKKQLESAFIIKVEEKVDYQEKYNELEKKFADLLARIDGDTDSELETLRLEYEATTGEKADKRWKVAKLKELLNK